MSFNFWPHVLLSRSGHSETTSSASQSCQSQDNKVQSATQPRDLHPPGVCCSVDISTQTTHNIIVILMNTLKKMQLRGTFIFKGTKGECSAVWPHYYPLRRTQEKLNWSYNLWFQVITDSQSEIHSHLQCHSVSIQVRMLWTKWTDVREQNRPAGTHHSPPSLSQNHTLTASNHYPQ